MIIRAISDSEDDNDTTEPMFENPVADHVGYYSTEDHTRSVFPSSSPSHVPSREGHVKFLWLGITLAIILLLFVDIAATMNQLFPVLEGNSVDAFNGISILFILIKPSHTLAASATTVNNMIGLAFTSIWIHRRESSLLNRRKKNAESRKSCLLSTPFLPYLPILSLILVWSLGHLFTCCYILFALFESRGSRQRFWMGHTQPNGFPV